MADESVRHLPAGPRQIEWLHRRLGFKWKRAQRVAWDGPQLVGYGALEQEEGTPGGDFRLFLVVPWWREQSTAIADALLSGLQGDAVRLNARRIWLREYAHDAPLIGYLLTRGFEMASEYEHEGAKLALLTSTRFSERAESH